MFRSFCCCNCGENPVDERQHLLQPGAPDPTEAVTARRIPPTRNEAQRVVRSGKLVMRRVGVPELDQRFSDVAETFNEQQQHYESMVQHISSLHQSCDCSHGGRLTLAECVGKMKEEHQAKYRVSLKMKGYDFCLSVVPVGLDGECAEEPEEIPHNLSLAQDELRGTCESARATISRATTLQELLGWLLRSSNQMAKQVKEAAPSHQEKGRLSENLEENIREVRRAKKLSVGYKQQADEVFTEAAKIAGAKF